MNKNLNKKFKKALIVLMTGVLIAPTSFADGMALPPQALPPIKPQPRPEAQAPATSVVIDYDQKKQSNVSEKTRREILAMLTDEVAQAENLVVIDGAMNAPQQDNVASVADQPQGNYRIFTDIAPNIEKGKVVVKLQLRRGGHVGDANELTKPMAETVIPVDPNNVRASRDLVHKFLASQLHIGGGNAKPLPGRPDVKMWIEVKNADGSDGIRVGSEMVIYYQPLQDSYANLYYLDEKDEIQRLIPSVNNADNFVRKNQIYRHPKTGALTVTGGNEVDRLRMILTTIPSGLPNTSGQLVSRTPPVAVIPTTFPTTFADQSLTHFFSLPETMWSEKEIKYTVEK